MIRLVEKVFTVKGTLLFLLVIFPNSGMTAGIAQVYNDAKLHDSTYLSDQFEQLAVIESLGVERASLLPNVSAFAGHSESTTNSNSSNLDLASFDNRLDQTVYGVSLSQVIYDGSLFHQYSKAKLQAELARIRLLRIEQELILRIAESYLDLLQRTDDLKLAQENLNSAEQQYLQTKSRFELGVGNLAEYQQSLARWQLARAGHAQALSSQRDSNRYISSLTNVEYENIRALKQGYDFSDNYDLAGLSDHSELTSRNFNFLELQLELAIAKKQLALTNAGHGPKLELVAAYEKSMFENNDLEQSRLSLQFQLPLYSGGGVGAASRQEKLNVKAIERQIEGLKRTILRNNDDFIDRAKSLEISALALGEASKASRTALTAKQEGFRAGFGTNLDVLDAQRDVFQISLEDNRVRYETILLSLNHKFLFGKLSEEILLKIDMTLE